MYLEGLTSRELYKLRVRLWAKVEKGSGPDRICWCWKGGWQSLWRQCTAPQAPQALITIKGRGLAVKRVVWELCGGKLDETKHIRARCGTELCVRPSHLSDKSPLDYRDDPQPWVSELPVSDRKATTIVF